MEDRNSGQTAWRWIIHQGLAALAFLLFCLIWHVLVTAFGIHAIVLPSPLRVLSTAWDERSVLLTGFISTGLAALVGLGMSILLGAVIGIIFSQAAWVRAAFYPYVMFLQTVPIVAIAPLMIIWFDYGVQTVVLISMIISLFPIISNVTTGLISIDAGLLDLFRLHKASRWQILWKLRIPHAISHLVLGIRVSAGLAVVGAIIGEFFVGWGASEYAGLGSIMTGWQIRGRTDGLIAVVIVSTGLGLCVLGGVNLISRLLLSRWISHTSFENG